MQSIIEKLIYCNSLTHYSRLQTREVFIGDVALGAKNPIRVQSMTTTDTMDTMGTVEQSIRMVDAGCEYVRITAPSIKEAQNLAEIKKQLRLRGYNVPLVAAAQGMYDLSTYPTDHYFWEFLALTTGSGGSVLIIGTAAGVAVMGIEQINFMWYLKKIGLLAFVGFAAGILMFFR